MCNPAHIEWMSGEIAIVRCVIIRMALIHHHNVMEKSENVHHSTDHHLMTPIIASTKVRTWSHSVLTTTDDLSSRVCMHLQIWSFFTLPNNDWHQSSGLALRNTHLFHNEKVVSVEGNGFCQTTVMFVPFDEIFTTKNAWALLQIVLSNKRG